MSIEEKAQEIKWWALSEKGKDTILVVSIALALLGAFGLGRLSVRGENSVVISSNGTKEVEIVDPLAFVSTASAKGDLASAESGPIVASKRGTKYYFTWCSGAKSLSAANKIYFQSEEEAKTAGYERSESCVNE